jgi:hypothetical protein
MRSESSGSELDAGPSQLRVASSWLIGALATTAASPIAAQQKVELLFPGDSYARRAWPKTGDTWLGLYSTSPGYRLAPTRIRVERVPDACGGSATRVSAESAAQPYLLLKGLDHLKTGPVDTAFAGMEFFYPGQSLSIKLGKPEKWYHVRALGTAGARRGEIFFTDYRLELHHSERLDAGQPIIQLKAMTLDNTPQLRWAGDLDRDGRLDLLLEVPIGGYSSRLVLLLSSRAAPPQLVKEVASFDQLDC